MAKGRHASSGAGGFYKDLAWMILGILLIGAFVFLLLYLLAGDGSSSDTTTTSEPGASTTSTLATTSTTGEITTTTATTPTTSDTVPVRPPAEVRVIVLNSIGTAGVAGRLTEVIAEAGYQTLEADNYEPEQDPSRIWYREGFSAEANELLDFVPGALVEPLSDDELVPGADVIVILGTGYEE